jgi:hypothetical protein
MSCSRILFLCKNSHKMQQSVSPVVASRISKINICRYLLWEVLDATSW